ncbi:MAG: nucleotide exchange factor GrpE [Candidatus Thermoplasmatota archaeon]|nr:nucleotide exchange factor GrpE [Candidatus Thermoplasmatota archaeon]
MTPTKMNSYQKLKSELSETKKMLKEKTKTADDYLSKLQWLQAEFENFRKRIDKEKNDYVKYANKNLIMKLLDSVDDLERIMNNIKDKEITDGLNMVYKNFLHVLENEGLKKIDASGKNFDPYKHEAFLQVVDNSKSENTVVEELQKGYMLNENVIRPAKVKISKKGE